MCGIAVVLGERQRDHETSVRTLTASLRHRGPNSEAATEIPLPGGRSLSLVHCRLAILDLSEAGRQPMEDPETGNVIVFNGEIYNFAELKEELLKFDAGYSYRSTSDTEVLLRAYAAWGTNVVGKCDGMFAFVLFDRRKNRLVVARDHAGIKPLYFAQLSPQEWVFSSEVRSILSTGLVPRRLSTTALADYLHFGAVQEPHTIIEGIEAFPAAHFAVMELDRPVAIKPQRYWSFADHTTSRTQPDDHASILQATVREQLVADVPIGLFLSAGIDSTALAIVAGRCGATNLRAFTISKGGEDDEAHLAAATSQRLGIPHQIFSLSPHEEENWLSDALASMDQPSGDGANTYVVSRASRSAGMIAALAGTGADEIHGGYDHFYTLPPLQKGWRAAAARTVGPTLLRWTGSRAKAERLSLLMGAAPSLSGMVEEKRRYFTPDWIQRAAPVNVTRPTLPGVLTGDSTDPLSQIAVAEVQGYLQNTLLRDSDWATMANGQELRVPYLGRRYMEFCAGVDWKHKTRSRKEGNKPLVGSLLPTGYQAVRKRAKTGFNLDYVSALTGGQCQQFLESSQRLNDLGFRISAEEILRQLKGPQAAKLARRAWALLALGSYVRQHGLTDPA